MNETIGDRLKRLRLEWGFTQEQIANYLGFKQSQIEKLEKNELALKHSSLTLLCVLYNCSHEYILEGEGEYVKPQFKFMSDKNDLNLETLVDMNLILNHPTLRGWGFLNFFSLNGLI